MRIWRNPQPQTTLASQPSFGRPPWVVLDLFTGIEVKRWEREQDAVADKQRREGDWQPGRYRVEYAP